MHRLARGSKLARYLSFRYTVEDLQNGAISVLGHPIAGITRLFISHKIKIKIKPDKSNQS
jgi:hypothetical protein